MHIQHFPVLVIKCTDCFCWLCTAHFCLECISGLICGRYLRGCQKQHRNRIRVIQRIPLVLLEYDCRVHILAVKVGEGIGLILGDDCVAIPQVLEGSLGKDLAVGVGEQDTAAGCFQTAIDDGGLYELPAANLD